MSTTERHALSLALPGGWVQVDLDLLAEDGAFEEQVASQLGDVDGIDALRELFVVYAKAAAESARSEGITFTAVYMDAVDDASVPVVASLSVAFMAQPADRGPDGQEPLARPEDEPAPTGRDESETTTVVLPIGTSLRVERVFAEPSDDGERVPVTYSVQYLVDRSEADDVIVMTFASPMVAFRAELNAMFERIAQSAQVGEESL